MDGENNGSKPYEQMDDLGGKKPYFWKHPYISKSRLVSTSTTFGAKKRVAVQDLVGHHLKEPGVMRD